MFEFNSEVAMRKIMSGFIALAMALPLGMTGNASALPRVETSVPSAVQQVQTNQGQFPGSFRSVNPDRQFSPWAGNVERRIDRRWDRPGRYYRDDRRFARRDRGGYYRGYRGYRDYRPGYRRYNDGFWYPAAAFITGAIVGGAIASQPAPRVRYRGYSSAHVEWCYDRYRSYRASDNTFQPYNGPRRACRSPYY